jgi:hypothetical protein
MISREKLAKRANMFILGAFAGLAAVVFYNASRIPEGSIAQSTPTATALPVTKLKATIGLVSEGQSFLFEGCYIVDQGKQTINYQIGKEISLMVDCDRLFVDDFE